MSEDREKGALAGIEGLGQERRARLIEHFGSAAAVLTAGVNQLLDVPGIGPTLATRVAERTTSRALPDRSEAAPSLDRAVTAPCALNGATEEISTDRSDQPSQRPPSRLREVGVAVRRHRSRQRSVPQPTSSPPDLEIRDLVVRFGGLTAVDGLTLHGPAGRITGLIGPNGAGKSTTFDAATGMTKPSEGSVLFGGRVLDGKSVAKRARLGLGRTFQRIELFNSMTVAENVALGPESLFGGRRPWGQLVATRSERADIAERADSAMGRCGIASLADRLCSDLSTGQRRLVELARALATRFTFLLLDEPSSGLDEEETERFGEILEDMTRSEDRVGILLVEHDMGLVKAICQYIYVLDFGQLIYQGEAADVLTSEVVRAAYLGTETAEHGRHVSA